MDIVERLNWRYATKKFDESKKLSKEKIEILKRAFNLTPSSYGLQVIKMVIVSDKLAKQELVDICYGQEQVNNASHVLVVCVQTKVEEKDVDTHFDNVKNIRNIPELIISKYREKLKSFIRSKTEVEIRNWCVNQAYITLGNLLTVCAIEGIDACPIEGFIPNKVDELLELEKYDLNSVLLLPVGYRAKDDMFAGLKKVRKNITETIIEL